MQSSILSKIILLFYNLVQFSSMQELSLVHGAVTTTYWCVHCTLCNRFWCKTGACIAARWFYSKLVLPIKLQMYNVWIIYCVILMQQSAKQELALLPGGLHFSLRIPHFMFSPTPAYYPGFGIFVRLFNFHIFLFLVFRHASVSSTYPGPGQSVVRRPY